MPDVALVDGGLDYMGRTKVLQEEIVAQATRPETLIFEDPLTGLANRRCTLTQLGALVIGARRHERALAAVLVDVDRFKAVNDRHGHAEGDRVLPAVAPVAASARARRGPAQPTRPRGVPRAAARYTVRCGAGRRRELRSNAVPGA